METQTVPPKVSYQNVTALKVGQQFFHRGRIFRLSEPACSVWGWDPSRGEYGQFKAWNDKGRETLLTVWERSQS